MQSVIVSMEARMKRVTHMAAGVVAVALFMIATAPRAAELSEAIVLVARDGLVGSPFEQTVVFAAPLPDGGHIGFIVNRPTTLKLETLFPDESPARNVSEPVFVGGPVLPQAVFALTQNAPDGTRSAIPLFPGVVAIVDGPSVDRIIETTPNGARYFVGVMLWDADELEDQVRNNLWEVRPADVETILPARANGLWNSLRSPMASAGTVEHPPAA